MSKKKNYRTGKTKIQTNFENVSVQLSSLKCPYTSIDWLNSSESNDMCFRVYQLPLQPATLQSIMFWLVCGLLPSWLSQSLIFSRNKTRGLHDLSLWWAHTILPSCIHSLLQSHVQRPKRSKTLLSLTVYVSASTWIPFLWRFYCFLFSLVVTSLFHL